MLTLRLSLLQVYGQLFPDVSDEEQESLRVIGRRWRGYVADGTWKYEQVCRSQFASLDAMTDLPFLRTYSTPSGAPATPSGSSSSRRLISSSISPRATLSSTKGQSAIQLPTRRAHPADAAFLLLLCRDLNHRKLTYDCQAPSTTPFDQAIGPLGPLRVLPLHHGLSFLTRISPRPPSPAASAAGAPPLLSLRTIKSDGAFPSPPLSPPNNIN